MKHLLLLLFTWAWFVPVTAAQCPGQQVRLEIQPDLYFMEISWQLTNLDGSVVYAEGNCVSSSLATFNYCVLESGCIAFRIKDNYGDGLMPDGFYRLFFNDTLIHENTNFNYHFSEITYFGCPPGSFCNDPFVADTGTYVTPENLPEAWYSFTPADTGTYQISTCFATNICATQIWLYDQCTGITLSNNQTGANFYADTGCTDGALATVYLAGGSTYFIRLRYKSDSCRTKPLYFSVSYQGPVIGCTDPLSCNYNPLASVSGDCLYPGNPLCLHAPDLVVLEEELKNSMFVQVINNGDACAVSEGCLRGTGARRIINFTTHIKNIGNQDYYIGPPPTNAATPTNQFVWDACHNHWHYRGYAEYILYNSAGTRLPVGTKNGFCVLDLECNDGGFGKYSCGNMGISADCGDIYSSGLPCQWIDITDLPADKYTFVVRVNWDKSPDKIGRVEKTYDNNWAQACFSLSYDASGAQVEFLDNDCVQYTDCLGQLFGDVQPDCEGVCNGLLQRGDWDKNAVRDSMDVVAYLAATLPGDAVATECRDLFADGGIDVYDAALLQECNLHHDDPNHWGVRFPCQFPAGLKNEDDIVYLQPGLLDTVAKTFTVQIINPFNRIIGYEFSVSGLQITAVENLVSEFDGPIQYDAVSGRIVALSPTETGVKKNILPGNLVRIHYDKIDAAQVCIANIQAVVNANYQESNALLVTPSCIPVGQVSSTYTPGSASFAVFAQPNPFYESTTLLIARHDVEPMTITLADLNGKVVRMYRNIRSDSVTFERGDLPSGVYLYSVQYGQGVVSGKVVAW